MMMLTGRKREGGPALRVSVPIVAVGIIIVSFGLVGPPVTSGPGTRVAGNQIAAQGGSAAKKGTLAAPVLTETPSNPSPTATSTFAWTHPQAGVAFRCTIDEGLVHTCSSPYTFEVEVTNNETHQFSVRAVSGATLSSPVTYSWKLARFEFTISGIVGDLAPGVWRPITLTLSSPHNFTVYATALNVAVSSSPAGCPASSNIEFLQSPVSGSNTIAIPAHGSTTVTGSNRPQIRLIDLATNQDACKETTFGLSFTGLATK